ncbi:MAG TPA: ScyD/ScyE family protein [Balneolaceae bacterium]|nr:ScyD/ScyE family protein [Balneolaceae bacterium]
MKNSTKNPFGRATRLVAWAAFLFIFISCGEEDNPVSPTPSLNITTLASGFHGLMGIESDDQGNIWVSEAGTDTADANGDTHNNTGKILLITPDGEKHDAIINLASYANINSGELQGAVHILLDDETLYILSGDYLYLADVSNFNPGDAPIDANTLPKEDIFSVISQIPSENNPDQDSHPYNLTLGPDGDLYITDAGANAIIRREGVNDYSVLAEIPPIPNPAFPDLGGPTVQSVPTSISYDGNNFLVTSLTGFPFPQEQAAIYSVSMSGDVSVYQTGFTMLVDQETGSRTKHIVVKHAASFNPASGFEPNSGSLIWVDGTTPDTLADGLNLPVGIEQVNDHTWYVTSLGDGAVLKVTYE